MATNDLIAAAIALPVRHAWADRLERYCLYDANGDVLDMAVVADALNRNADLEARVAELEKALRHYANRENWYMSLFGGSKVRNLYNCAITNCGVFPRDDKEGYDIAQAALKENSNG